MANKILILLYHDLESDDCINEKVDKAAKDTVVSVAQFEKQIKYLAESGYTTISVNVNVVVV